MNVEYEHSVFSAVYHGMCAQCLVMIQWNIGKLHTKVLLILYHYTTQCTALSISSNQSRELMASSASIP